MAYDNLLYEINEGVATITVNRPQVLNALNIPTFKELEAAFSAARDDAAVRVIIITGAGDKAFIAGGDVKEIHEVVKRGPLGGRDGLPLRIRPLMDLILGLGKPVIAAVNGYCLGGGCELLYACTLAYAAEEARFGQPEINLGFNPCWGATQQLARLAGSKKAMELILMGEMFDAAEAYRLGVVNAVVPAEELMPTVQSVAAKLADKPPLAVKLSMECIHSAGELTLAQGLELEAAAFGMLCGTEDIIEGTGAFLEKRQAQFRGN
jgi:enoyl-CoA hydratase/carnithine racemase